MSIPNMPSQSERLGQAIEAIRDARQHSVGGERSLAASAFDRAESLTADVKAEIDSAEFNAAFENCR